MARGQAPPATNSQTHLHLPRASPLTAGCARIRQTPPAAEHRVAEESLGEPQPRSAWQMIPGLIWNGKRSGNFG